MKTKAMYIYSSLLIVTFILFLSISYHLVWFYTQHTLQHFKHQTLVQSVNHRIEKTMNKDRIPGLSVALIQRNQVVLNKGYGYANVKQHTLADAHTRYEIASNTKAFTGLAILELAKQGKIKLDAPFSKYLPWLHLNYEGQEQAVTLNMLLAQTSGIDDHMSLDIEGDVPTKQDHLKGHVESLNHAELKYQPGDVFNYANMNYNILGLVIQEVTDTPYEDYMHAHMLKPLHMNQSYFKTDQQQAEKAQGYVLEGSEPKADDPDYFRGDTPAAYLISSTSDLVPFVKMNLQPPASHQTLIKQSHTSFTKNLNQAHINGYGAGWFIDASSNQILHPGTLPNYSSMILLDTKRHNAVILLANLNAPDIPELAQTLLYQVQHDQTITALYQATSEHRLLLSFILWWVIIIFNVVGVACIRNIARHRHSKHTSSRLNKRSTSLSVLIVIGLLYSAWHMPSWILKDADWSIAFHTFPPVLLWIGIGSITTLLLSVFYFNSCLYLRFKRPHS